MVCSRTRLLASVLALTIALPGCAKIQSSTTYTETLVRRKASTSTVKGSLRYSLAPRLDGQVLSVAIRSEELCRTKVTPIYRKEAHVARRTAPDTRGLAFSPPTMVVYGLALGATGVYTYASADSLGTTEGAMGESTPEDYRTGGIALGAAGAVMLGIALIDAIRLIDEDKVVGEISGQSEVTEKTCHARPTTNTEVIATVGRLDWTIRASTDAKGAVRLDLHDLPEDAFSRPELAFSLEIDGATAPLVLPATATALLLASLAEDTTSQLARAREARVRASCAEQVAAASSVAIDGDTPTAMIERAEAGWRSARNRCGSAWEPAHEQALAAFGALVASTAAERAIKDCAQAGEVAHQLLVQRAEAGDPLEIEGLRAELTDQCASAENSPAALAALEGRARAVEAARAQAEQRDARIAQLAERLRRNDAVAVRTIIGRDREIAKLVRAAPEATTWLVQMASHWIRQLERDESASVLRQLCAARSLVLTFAGRDAWARLRAGVVRRHDVAKGARIAKTMDGGACT